MNQTRRNFIKVTAVASASLLPAARSLAHALATPEEEIESLLNGTFNKEFEFHVLDTNLLNIHFYFINVERSGRRICPKLCDRNSFMIIRLPQQHVSEAGIKAADVCSSKPAAELSGYSFLAFQLWPTFDRSTCIQERKKTFPWMPFDLETLLNWNDEKKFMLVTLTDWIRLAQRELRYVDVNLITSKRVDPDVQDPDEAVGNETSYEPGSSIFRKYKQIVSQLLFNESPLPPATEFIPVTLLEVPNKLFIVPFFRKPAAASELRRDRVIERVRFLRNPEVNPRTLSRKFEVWRNGFWFERSAESGANEDSRPGQFVIERPYFRAVGYSLGKKDTPADDQLPIGGTTTPDESPATGFQPSLLTRKELVFLTQYVKGPYPKENHTEEEFDIRELDGFFFTGLGAITHLKYYNIWNIPRDVDLVEYEHIITSGRDVFVKVSRIGINCKTGQRYKHVIESTRKISECGQPAAYLDLKQYCECIETGKVFKCPSDEDCTPTTYFKPEGFDQAANEIFAPVLVNLPHIRRVPFSEINVIEKERIPIEPHQDGSVGNNIPVKDYESVSWFWPILEGTGSDPKYLPCNIIGKDWEGRGFEASTPFIFIRKKVFDNPDEGTLKKIYNSFYRFSENEYDTGNNRRRIFLNKAIGYTPGFKKPEGIPDKGNIIETEYIETYFNILEICSERFVDKDFPLLPQLLQGKAYIDAIKELTGRKLVSYIDYHPKFVEHGFGPDNQAKQILKHTDAFIASVSSSKIPHMREPRKAIINALHEAKDRLGNLATPDIHPDSISLAKYGITLPINANLPQTEYFVGETRVAEKLIRPGDFLQKFSDILGGIDLRAILHEFIPDADAPLFELNKIATQIDDAIQSEVYQQIINFQVPDPITGVKTPLPELLKKYEGEVQHYKKEVEKFHSQIRSIQAELSKLVPNTDQLNDLVKNVFEQLKTEAFGVDLSMLPFAGNVAHFRAAATRAIENLKQYEKFLKDGFSEKFNELVDVRVEVNREIASIASKVPARILEIGAAGVRMDIFLQTKIIDKFYEAKANLFDFTANVRTIFDGVDELLHLNILSKPVFIRVENGIETWEITADPAAGVPLRLFQPADVAMVKLLQIEKKIQDIRRIIVKSTSTDPFTVAVTKHLRTLISEANLSGYLVAARNVAAKAQSIEDQVVGLKKDIEAWQGKIFDYINKTESMDAAVQHALLRVNEILLKVQPYVDLLRRADPYYYYLEQQRLKKEIKDIRLRFSKVLSDKLDAIVALVRTEADNYRKVVDSYNIGGISYEDLSRVVNVKIQGIVNQIGERVIRELKATPDYRQAEALYAKISSLTTDISNARGQLDNFVNAYGDILKDEAEYVKHGFERRIAVWIEAKEKELRDAVGDDNIKAAENAIKEARNLYKLVTSIKQQDMVYKWSTDRFRDFNLGVISFKKFDNPPTELKVDVRATTHFTEGKFPPSIREITTSSENRLTNFSIGLFQILTVGFSEVSFSAGSNRSSDFNVKIKDVKFDGALSFVQAFEEYFKTIGKGLILNIQPDHVALGYSFPIPAIKTPSFSFFNLSLNLDFRVHFDKRPMRFGFSLARPDAKFGLTAGIYAGFGFFALVAEPKRGIVEIDVGLEGGAWSGIRIGPIKGEVKLAFGFRYTKRPTMVRLEGYIVAEGRLTVWILEVSARIYLGIVSENSYVEGRCTVTYKVKKWRIERKFSGSFYRKISGAKSKSNSAQEEKMMVRLGDRLSLLSGNTSGFANLANGVTRDSIAALLITELEKELTETYPVSDEDFEMYFKVS